MKIAPPSQVDVQPEGCTGDLRPCDTHVLQQAVVQGAEIANSPARFPPCDEPPPAGPQHADSFRLAQRTIGMPIDRVWSVRLLTK